VPIPQRREGVAQSVALRCGTTRNEQMPKKLPEQVSGL
jgi:hypothetical protein